MLPTKKESGTARFFGSASAGILELLVFHPVDTVAKRLMTNSTKIQASGDLANVIFKVSAIKQGSRFEGHSCSIYLIVSWFGCCSWLQGISKVYLLTQDIQIWWTAIC
jgi:hypothetical protein